MSTTIESTVIPFQKIASAATKACGVGRGPACPDPVLDRCPNRGDTIWHGGVVIGQAMALSQVVCLFSDGGFSMEPGIWLMRPWVMDDAHAVALQLVRERHRDFDGFYESSWAGVYRPLAVTLRDPDLAAEAVDEAMARAFRSWRKVRDYDNQSGWVYRVALNWATSYLRKTRREVHGRVRIDSAVAATQPDMDLYDALGHLDVKQRAAVVLRYLLDWSEDDVASALGVPNGTVKSRLHRALVKLREELA